MRQGVRTSHMRSETRKGTRVPLLGNVLPRRERRRTDRGIVGSFSRVVRERGPYVGQ